MGNTFNLRILLVMVDNSNDLDILKQLNKLAFATNYTLILAWSNLECARYLECYAFYHDKPTATA